MRMIYRYGEGFRYDTMYPANDPANAEYNDVDGKTQKKNIKVPDVKAPTPGEEIGGAKRASKSTRALRSTTRPFPKFSLTCTMSFQGRAKS